MCVYIYIYNYFYTGSLNIFGNTNYFLDAGTREDIRKIYIGNHLLLIACLCMVHGIKMRN